MGYGHGVLICGSFVTAGDARAMLKEHASPVMKKAMSIHQATVEPDDREDAEVEAEAGDTEASDTGNAEMAEE